MFAPLPCFLKSCEHNVTEMKVVKHSLRTETTQYSPSTNPMLIQQWKASARDILHLHHPRNRSLANNRMICRTLHPKSYLLQKPCAHVAVPVEKAARF